MQFLKNIYVINLDRSKNRLDLIDKNLKHYNLNYKRFRAVDGKKLPLHVLNQYVTQSCRYLLCNRSIVGCALSHILLWKHITQSNDSWHLILEDDCHFTDKTVPFINNLQGKFQDNESVFINLKCTGLLCRSYPSHIDNLYIPIWPVGFGAYLITKHTAKLLHDYFMTNKINYNVDIQTCMHFDQLNISYYTTPDDLIKDHGLANSTIANYSMTIPSYVLRKIGLESVDWFMACPYLTIDLKYSINLYIACFIFLFLINYMYFSSKLLYIYLSVEVILFLYQV